MCCVSEYEGGLRSVCCRQCPQSFVWYLMVRRANVFVVEEVRPRWGPGLYRFVETAIEWALVCDVGVDLRHDVE